MKYLPRAQPEGIDLQPLLYNHLCIIIISMAHKMIECICLCGCGEKFIKDVYTKGYIRGHHNKFFRYLQIGSKAPGWKGGVRKHRGYIFIYSPTHPAIKHTPRSPYVKRSRLIMEKKLGRYLGSQEVVHHINGIRDDDHIENLMLTTRAGHNHIHKSK